MIPSSVVVAAAWYSGMTLLRMDNILIVVDDLKAAIGFFAELGMELEGEAVGRGASPPRSMGDCSRAAYPDGN